MNNEIKADGFGLVTGRVTNSSGAPQGGVAVRIDEYKVGAQSAADGSYRLVVPNSRIRAGRPVLIIAMRSLDSDRKTITLSPGQELVQNFQLP